MKEWQFCALLPNLRLKEPIGNEVMSMVSYEDTRLREIANADARLRVLLENFTDQFDRKRYPSAIISRLPAAPLPGGDLIDFRNVVAISCFVGGAQHWRPPMSTVFPIDHSDYFDLYPIFLPCNAKSALLTNSHAGIGMDTELEKFRGQTSPGLHNVDAGVPIADPFLLDTLLVEWNALYVDGRPVDNRVVGLFRSLQVAYHAAAMPAKNHASLHDFGISVSHWVSAMEILLHPEKGDVNERHVLNELSKYPWQALALRRTKKYLPSRRRNRECAFFSLFKGRSAKANFRTMPLNAVQILYHQLYKTRNDFVHGNDLVNAPHHSPLQNMKGPGWLEVAPLVFKAALSCFFNHYDNKTHIEDALTTILSLSPDMPGENQEPEMV
jgi:hypothetical protein